MGTVSGQGRAGTPEHNSVLDTQVDPSTGSLGGWMELATASPRHPSILAGKHSEMVKPLTAALARYTHDVSKVVSTPDRREPEYVLYDTTIATMNVYRVKPAVFDLFLSAAIGCYLGILYLILNNSSGILLFLASFVKEKKETDNHHHHSNGHVKANGI